MHLVMVLLFLFASEAAAADRSQLQKERDAEQMAENAQAESDGLTYIPESLLADFLRSGIVVNVESMEGITIDPRLDKKYRWVRPHAALYLKERGTLFYAAFGKRFPLTSAGRTLEKQSWLRYVVENKNAATVEGPLRSVHPTGAAVDIGKRGLSQEQQEWLRKDLALLKARGVLLYIEENQQPCFHVFVFKSYADRDQPD